MEFLRIADRKRVTFITSSITAYARSGSAVLDVGCGNGFITKALADAGFFVTGIDQSEKTIAQARSLNAHPNVQYRVAGAVDLRDETARYDAIVCSEVLEHLHDPRSLLHTLYDLLVAQGVLVVTVPNGAGPRELLVTRPVQYLQERNNFFSRLLRNTKRSLGYSGVTEQSSAEDLRHIQFFTAARLKQLAASERFRIQVIRKTNFVEQVFPFSLLARRISLLQRLDCAVAELLPLSFTSGFMSIWKKI